MVRGQAERGRAGGLVADCHVELALLVEDAGADGVANVVEHVVLGDPAERSVLCNAAWPTRIEQKAQGSAQRLHA